MKFAGQVRFPDVDHPGIPVMFLVEENQAEVVLDGESLGRWSLFDVHARRLVSSAFEVSLAKEEITFIAEKPMDFAYRGIEHMAEVWAKFKAKGFIRRFVSVKLSRRGSQPSRLGELRAAMIENLSHEPVHEALPGARFESHAELPAVAPKPPAPEPAAEAGAQAQPVTQPESLPADDRAEQVSAELAALEAERARIEEDRKRLEAERAAAEREVAESIAAARAEIERLERERAALKELEEARKVEEADAPTEDDGTAEAPAAEGPSTEEADAVDEADEPTGPSEAEETVEPPETDESPELVEEILATSAEASSGDQVGDLVVDLGKYEEQPVEDPSAEPEPALAAAGQKSGLMGAVKAAFTRNGGRNHVHDFVEAPAGIGIVRSICRECGFVSISTSD